MRRLVVATVVLAALAAPPAAVATFVPGPNGKVAFTSGRGGAPNNDNEARIWVADYPFGMPAQATTVPAGQHRHPSWSPDHTRIVYAVGPAFGGTYALWIKDLTDGSSFEFVAAAAGQDRPSWSPDGTKIAYGAGGDLWVKAVEPPGATPVQITQGAAIDERPVWSQDGETLYFNRGPTTDRDLYKKSPVTLAGAETGVVTGATNDWQPALSPDDQRLCYLRGAQNDTANLRTVNVNGTGDTPFSSDATLGDLNCVWSPDGTRIVYTLGAFSAGDLASRNVNGGDFTLLTSMNVAQHFDGNADWATNFSPACEDRAVDVGFNGFAAVTLACTDPDSGAGIAPPTPEGLGANDLEIATPPAHGVLGSISDSGSVIYTPDKDFQGSDSFTYTGSDGTSDADPATVAIAVAGPGGPGPGGPGADTTAPEISDLSISPRRWRRGSALPAAAQAAVGTTIAFRLSEAAEATLRFRRAKPGRRAGGKCVKPTRRNRARRRCRRYVAAGRLARPAAAGLTRLRFEGRLSSAKRLKRGRHRLVVAAEDAAGNRATSPPLSFTIVR